MSTVLANPPVTVSEARPGERLDAAQVGSSRQIENIVSKVDGEWAMVGGCSNLQEDFGADRFQFAYAGLALAPGHYQRLPNTAGGARAAISLTGHLE